MKKKKGRKDTCMSYKNVLHGEGYSEELEVKVGFTKALYSACCFSLLCWKPCHVSSAVGSHGRTSMLTTLLS